MKRYLVPVSLVIILVVAAAIVVNVLPTEMSTDMSINIEGNVSTESTQSAPKVEQAIPSQPEVESCQNTTGVKNKFLCMNVPPLYPAGSVEELADKETFTLMRHVNDDANKMWQQMFTDAGYSYIPSELEFDMDYKAFGKSGKRDVYFKGNTMVIPNPVTWGQEASDLPDIVNADRYTLVMIVAYNVAQHAMRQAVDSSLLTSPEVTQNLGAYLTGIYFYSRVRDHGGYMPEGVYHGASAGNRYFTKGYSTGEPKNVPLGQLGQLA